MQWLLQSGLCGFTLGILLWVGGRVYAMVPSIIDDSTPVPAFARITMQNGKVVRGEVLEESDNNLRISTGDMILTINPAMIVSREEVSGFVVYSQFAQRALERGDRSGAIRFLEQAIALDPAGNLPKDLAALREEQMLVIQQNAARQHAQTADKIRDLLSRSLPQAALDDAARALRENPQDETLLSLAAQAEWAIHRQSLQSMAHFDGDYFRQLTSLYPNDAVTIGLRNDIAEAQRRKAEDAQRRLVDFRDRFAVEVERAQQLLARQEELRRTRPRVYNDYYDYYGNGLYDSGSDYGGSLLYDDASLLDWNPRRSALNRSLGFGGGTTLFIDRSGGISFRSSTSSRTSRRLSFN